MKKNLYEEDVGSADTYVKDNLSGDYSDDLVNRLTVTDKGMITLIEKELADLEVVEGVIIPRGFEHVEGTEVAKGLVIKNSTDENEFVWVPVEEDTFAREAGYVDGSLQSDWNTTDYLEPYETTDYTSEREEYDAMVASVSKYGGFYIARYEASDNGSGVAQSIANQTPWSLINWGGMTSPGENGAVGKARAVYPVSSANQGDAVSTLIYGVQWDATVRFLETNYDGIAKNSTGYGNYGEDSEIINTGSNSSYALNNIYDLAGNLIEWTMEAYSSSNRVLRGGDLNVTDGIDTVSGRGIVVPYAVDGVIGFRLALYIK